MTPQRRFLHLMHEKAAKAMLALEGREDEHQQRALLRAATHNLQLAWEHEKASRGKVSQP